MENTNNASRSAAPSSAMPKQPAVPAQINATPQVTQAPAGHIMSTQEYEKSINQPASSGNAAFTGGAHLNSLSSENGSQDKPVPVVKVLSVRGLEYFFMSFALWFTAGSLIVILLLLINGIDSFSELSFPSSTLIVSLPVFAVLFLRLRKAENDDETLRLDASKRRLSQITQILAFLACFFNITAFVYSVMQAIGGSEGVSVLKSFFSLLVVLMIAGGVLVYYWFNEHRTTA